MVTLAEGSGASCWESRDGQYSMAIVPALPTRVRYKNANNAMRVR